MSYMFCRYFFSRRPWRENRAPHAHQRRSDQRWLSSTSVFKLSLGLVNIFAMHSPEIIYIWKYHPAENCWCGNSDYSDFLQSEITDWNGLGGVWELHLLKI